MHRFLVCLLLLATAATLRAAGATVSGVVTDSESGRKLAGARVSLSLESTGRTAAFATADFDGSFTLKLSPPEGGAVYSLSVAYTGYETKTLASLSLVPGSRQRLEITLLPTIINLNPVVITPSRHAEKMLETPAQVSVVGSREIGEHDVLTPTDYLAVEPAVDLAQTGLNHEEVVVRGFNGIYNGHTMMLIDDRDIRLPNFRINILYDMPTSVLDLESIEVVSGPASALYGANSAYGVVHYRTLSPFASQGSTISLSGGERGVVQGAFRNAGLLTDKLGYKISFRHFQGRDWKSSDPAEPDSLQLVLPTAEGSVPVGGEIVNHRDYGLRNSAFDLRIDYRPDDDLSAVFSGGLTRTDIFNVTNQGALQAEGFVYGYFQSRLQWRNIFAQFYLNSNDSNDDSYGYFLRNGLVLIDHSKDYAAQLQHSFSLPCQTVTWGADAHLVRPETRHTFHGRNENNDNINETGLYAQDEFQLSRKLELIAAGRLDKHNRLENVQFSPRAALTFSPTDDQHVRLTFNHAFTAPNTPRLFWDFQAGAVPNPFAPLNPNFDDNLVSLRVSGMPLSGYHFPRDNQGLPQMVSQFAGGTGYTPATVNSVWPAMRAILVAQNPQLDPALPPTLGATVPGLYRDLFNNRLMTNVQDIPRLKPELTSSLELGYKSLFRQKFLLSASLYHTRIKNFIAFTYTPAVFADPAALAATLGADIAARLMAAGLPAAMAQAQAQAITAQIVPSLAALPIGVVSPREVDNATDIFRTNRNFGSISFYGADLGLDLRAGRHWGFNAAYSFVSRDLFRNVDNIQDIPLNAPRHKVGLGGRYTDPSAGWRLGLRLRWADRFPAQDGVYSGDVPSYTVLDLDTGYMLPFNRNLELGLTVNNVLDNRHIEFAGAPKIGRLALLRITYRY